MLLADRIAYLADDGLDRYPPAGQGNVNLAAIQVGDQGRGRPAGAAGQDAGAAAQAARETGHRRARTWAPGGSARVPGRARA